MFDLRSQTRVTGRCSDLGSGGCYIDTLSPFIVGTAVRVRIVRDSQEFEAAAVVAYAHVSMGMGMAFTEITREHQRVLQSWIANLSGEQTRGSAASEASAEEAEPEPGVSIASLQLVVNELLTLLIRKKIITENEGAKLLRELFR